MKIESKVVQNTAAFMEALRSRPYQLILCDYGLPGWSGAKALRWVRSSGFKMPFIYVSGTVGEELAVECMKNGATDYVLKDKLERLPHAVRHAMQEEQLRVEKENAEAEVRRSEERYRLLFDSNPQSMWVFHLATLRFLAVNQAAIDHYEFSRSEFLSMTLRDIGLPEDATALEKAVWKEGSYPEKTRVWRHRTKFGRVIHAEITGRNIEFEGRAAALVLANDVTALKRSEENFRLLFEQTPDGIFVADAQGHYLDVNPAGVKLMGYSRDEIRQRTITDVLAPGEIGLAAEIARLHGGLTTEWRFKRKDGSIFDGSMVARRLSDGRLLAILRDITESKRAQESLRESEDRYRDLVESSHDLICTHDLEGRLLSANPASANVLGYEVAELVKIPLREIVTREFREQFDRYLVRIKDNGADHGLMAVRTRTGERRIWEYGNSLRTEGVSSPIVRGMARDVTERVVAEKQLRESEARLRLLVRSANVGLWDWNLITNDVYFSPEWKSQIGYADDEIPNRFEEWQSRVHPDDVEEAVQKVRAFIANPQGRHEDEFRFRHKDGSYRWIYTQADVLRDATGKSVRMLGCHLDITDRKLADRARRETEERYRGLFERTSSGVAVYRVIDDGEDFVFVDFNHAAEQIERTKRKSVIGRRVTEAFPGVKEFGIFSVFQRVWRTGKSEYFPPAIYRDERDRETWRESWVYRLTSGEIVTVYNEITERKRAEEALRESEARLNEAQHNAHIGSWRYLPPEMFIWSDEMYELFKLPREIPVTHAAALSQVHPEDRAGNSQGAFKRALESGKAHFSSEYRVIWPDGQIRWMSSIGKIRRDAAGRAIDASGTVQDITERKLTEEALQQSERKYFSLFDGMSEGFGLHELIFDGEGKPCDFRFLELNRAWEEHMGVPRRTVVGRTMKEVWPKLAPYWLELFSKVAMTGDPVRYENMNDELHRWFETFAYSTKRNQFALLSIDITKRKQAEEALSRSEENFRSLFEQAPDGIFTTDADGHFLDANRAGMQMLGYSADELRHLSVSDIVAPEDLHQVGLQLDRLASGELVVSEWRFQPKVGPFRHGELVAKRLSDGRLQAMVRDITDRKQAETALRESERQLNEAQHSAHIGSWRYRPDGTFVVSDEIYELYKLPRDAQVTFESFVAALHPEDQARAAARFQKQLESGALDFSQNEDRVVWPDGQVRNTMSLGKIRRDADGRVIEVVGTAQDVTERVLAEAALRESEEKFRTLADFVPQMVWMCTPDGLNTYFNHRWVEYTGMTLEESYGRGWNTPFHDDDKQKAWDAWNHAVATGDPYRVESRLRGADGSYRWFLMQGIPLRDASGNIVKWFGSCTDVEDMKHAENALRKAEERFSKAFHNAPMAITISTETDGRYVDVNDAFLDMLGYRREDFVGHTAAELRFWMEMSDREEMLRQLKEGGRGTVAKHNARYQTTKGELREAEVWAQSIELDGQPCVLAITRDITEIRLLEAEFRQAQKMEAVGLLAGGVAHDFNNLLMIIGSYARLIPMHIEDRKKVERDAMQIDEAVSRAASVTRQLLAFSRKQVLQPTVLSVNSLVLTLSKMLPRLLGEDVEMSLVRNATGKVKADATQLEQVILNLAVNARDAMPSGGKLIIETADVNSDGVYPRHPGTVIPAGDYVMIAR